MSESANTQRVIEVTRKYTSDIEEEAELVKDRKGSFVVVLTHFNDIIDWKYDSKTFKFKACWRTKGRGGWSSYDVLHAQGDEEIFDSFRAAVARAIYPTSIQ